MTQNIIRVTDITPNMISIQNAAKKFRIIDLMSRALRHFFKQGLRKIKCGRYVYFYKEELAAQLGLPNLDDDFMTKVEVSNYLGLPIYTIETMVSKSMLKTFQLVRKPGSQVLFFKSEVEQKLNSAFVQEKKAQRERILGINALLSSQGNIAV